MPCGNNAAKAKITNVMAKEKGLRLINSIDWLVHRPIALGSTFLGLNVLLIFSQFLSEIQSITNKLKIFDRPAVHYNSIKIFVAYVPEPSFLVFLVIEERVPRDNQPIFIALCAYALIAQLFKAAFSISLDKPRFYFMGSYVCQFKPIFAKSL